MVLLGLLDDAAQSEDIRRAAGEMRFRIGSRLACPSRGARPSAATEPARLEGAGGGSASRNPCLIGTGHRRLRAGSPRREPPAEARYGRRGARRTRSTACRWRRRRIPGCCGWRVARSMAAAKACIATAALIDRRGRDADLRRGPRRRHPGRQIAEDLPTPLRREAGRTALRPRPQHLHGRPRSAAGETTVADAGNSGTAGFRAGSPDGHRRTPAKGHQAGAAKRRAHCQLEETRSDLDSARAANRDLTRALNQRG